MSNYFVYTAYSWCSGHSISINVFRVWGTRDMIQVSKNELHIHIHLDYVRIKYYLYVPHGSLKKKNLFYVLASLFLLLLQVSLSFFLSQKITTLQVPLSLFFIKKQLLWRSHFLVFAHFLFIVSLTLLFFFFFYYSNLRLKKKNQLILFNFYLQYFQQKLDKLFHTVTRFIYYNGHLAYFLSLKTCIKFLGF